MLALVYLKVYAATGARFSLGIVVVVLALLLQSIFQSPLLLGFVGRYAAEFGPYLSSADIFTIAAYTVFLYLSLEQTVIARGGFSGDCSPFEPPLCGFLGFRL